MSPAIKIKYNDMSFRGIAEESPFYIQTGDIMKNILLIGDTVSACRVALSAMEPVLIKAGFNVSTLPTAIVSQTFGYKGVTVHSTGDYVAKALTGFENSGFDFDRIYVGYVTEEEQVQAITDYCRLKSAQGKLIFVDPVMGEAGHLYYGMDETNRQYFKNILQYADYALPSYTEAAFIAGLDYTKNPEDGDIKTVIENLKNLGVKNIAMTSTNTNGGDYTVVSENAGDEYKYLPCDHIPVKVAGTGDLFAACFIAAVLSGDDIATAARKAMDTVRHMVDKNKDKADKMRGVDF